jgi:hypothetical protein
LTALISTAASAQQVPNDITQRFDRELQQLHQDTSVLANTSVSTDQRALFDYGGYATVSYLSLDDLNRNNHSLDQYDMVGYADLNIDQVQEAFVRARLEWQEFSPGDAFDGRDHQFHATVERAYYRFDLGKAMSAYRGVNSDNGFAIKAGRQYVYWGEGLAFAQTLDGALIDLSHQKTSVQFVAGTTPAFTVDIDPSRPHFDNNTHRGFYGLMLSQQIGTHTPFIYYVAQQDNNHDYVSITGAASDAIHTHFNYNSNYLSIGSRGTFNDHLAYGGEAIWESGSTLSNSVDNTLTPIVQSTDRIEAFAGDLRLDYLMNDSRKTRFSLEGIFATGDDGRRQTTNTLGGPPPNTRDTAFNGFGQIQNGEAFSPNVSNLFILRGGASLFPLQDVKLFRQMQMGLDVFLYEKFAVSAPLDEPSSKNAYVGIEPDLFMNWKIASDVTLAMRYGVFFPGSAITNNNTRQFFYTGITLAF